MSDIQALQRLGGDALLSRMLDGKPVDPDAIAGWQYLGVDLSLPRPVQRLLWQTFRKTFVRDPATGVVRGWNVRMQQTGVDGPAIPMTDRAGRPRTFGHYELRSTAGMRFPLGWRGTHYLDYGVAGNVPWDLARFARAPLVALDDAHDLLLGWEVFALGPLWLPLPLFWALRRHSPVEAVVPRPRR